MSPSTARDNSTLTMSNGKQVIKYDKRHGFAKYGRGVILVLADEKRRVFVDKVHTIDIDTGAIETSTERYEPS